MNIKITAQASEKLKELLEEKNTDKSLRVYIAGYG